MERVNLILENENYIKLIRDIEKLEEDRIFCHHDMVHFLDVARIARIICMEEGIDISTSLIYAGALLHDIGRKAQYEVGTPHEEESARLCGDILEDAGYTEKEIAVIKEAIKCHGDESVMSRKDLTGVLYRADKLSRPCFNCAATENCHKKIEKRNMRIKV